MRKISISFMATKKSLFFSENCILWNKIFHIFHYLCETFSNFFSYCYFCIMWCTLSIWPLMDCKCQMRHFSLSKFAVQLYTHCRDGCWSFGCQIDWVMDSSTFSFFIFRNFRMGMFRSDVCHGMSYKFCYLTSGVAVVDAQTQIKNLVLILWGARLRTLPKLATFPWIQALYPLEKPLFHSFLIIRYQ